MCEGGTSRVFKGAAIKSFSSEVGAMAQLPFAELAPELQELIVARLHCSSTQRSLFQTCQTGRSLVLRTAQTVTITGCVSSPLIDLPDKHSSIQKLVIEECTTNVLHSIKPLADGRIRGIELTKGCDISAWAGSSVASALRRVQSLALRNISVSGPAFFTELARVCKHLHTLILDKVHLADAGAQASLSALGTGLPSLAELHVSGMEPEVLAPHTALLTRLTHLSHEVRGGSKPQGSLFYGLICDAVHARTAATQQGSSPANQPPSQQLLPFMSLQELSLPGVSLPWHILAALSSFSQLSHVSLHSLVKPDHLGHAYLSTTTDKLAPSLQCISLKYMSVSEAARMPGLASVPDLRVDYLLLPDWRGESEPEALNQLRAAAVTLGAVHTLTARPPTLKGSRTGGVPSTSSSRSSPASLSPATTPNPTPLSSLSSSPATSPLKAIMPTSCRTYCYPPPTSSTSSSPVHTTSASPAAGRTPATGIQTPWPASTLGPASGVAPVCLLAMSRRLTPAELTPQVIQALAPMARHLRRLSLAGLGLSCSLVPAIASTLGPQLEEVCLAGCTLNDPQVLPSLVTTFPSLTALTVTNPSWSKPLGVEGPLASAVQASQRPLVLRVGGSWAQADVIERIRKATELLHVAEC